MFSRGCLRAFGSCTDRGFGQRVGKIWRACNSPSRKNSTSHLFWLLKTWSKLFTPVPPVPTCSHLFTLVHTCSHLFTTVHTCSHLFTPVHTFSHRFTPLHTSVTIYALCAMAVSRWIFPLQKLFFFDLTCYLVEIAYFCSPNRELSNGVWLE